MERRLRIYQLGWTVAFAILLAVTYPLWLGPSGLVTRRYPTIPLVSGLTPYLSVWNTVGWVGILLGLVLQWFPRPNRQRFGAFTIAMGLLISVMGDQHHLQAWAYQFLLVALLVAWGSSDARVTIRRLRWLVASIYVYSAISKWDASFAGSLGPQMLDAIFQSMGLPLPAIADPAKGLLTMLLPTGEFLIGIGLLTGRYPRVVVAFGVLMHLILMVVVGPLGWGQQWGVSIWNLFFIFQAVVLFWPVDTQKDGDVRSVENSRPKVLKWGDAVLAFAVLFPLAEPMGYCDHWLAWELYAPRTSRVQVFIASVDAEQLPEEVRGFLRDDQQGWRELDLADWSLSSRHAPVYPEDRYQMAVGLSLERWLPGDRSVRFLWRSAANRITGKREERWLRGFDEARQFSNRFFWNVNQNH